ncbi:MAG: hypothetical protein HFE92_03750 [Acutalibacter muris]|nr:hypothetical protein [Acutalibacter muris]
MTRTRIISIISILSLLLLTLSGCLETSDQVYSQAMQQSSKSTPEESSEPEIDFDAPNYIGPSKDQIKEPEPLADDDLSGELVIKSCYLEYKLPYLAKEFMALHPNVTITFDIGIPTAENDLLTRAEREVRRESFYTQMRVELASGEGDYLLYRMDERFHIPQLSRSGLIEDLWPYFENDPDLDSSEYFQPVLDAFSCDGKLPVIPVSFMFDAAYLNRGVLSEIDVEADAINKVSVTQLLDWYEKAAESNSDLNLFFTSPDKKTLFPIERPNYIDLDRGTSSFESPEFISFLERTQAINDQDPDLDYETEQGVMDSGLFNEQIRFQLTGSVLDSAFGLGPELNEKFRNVAVKSRPAFAAIESVMSYTLLLMDSSMEYAAGPYPLISSNGTLGLTSLDSFAIPSSCTSKGLAWEFIKYCISPRSEELVTFSHLGSPGLYTSDIPLSKTNFQNNLKYYAQNDDGNNIVVYNLDSVDVEAVTKKLEQVLSLPLVNSGSYGIDVQEFLDEYYVNGLGTAEQCAKKIQDRVNIWLHE